MQPVGLIILAKAMCPHQGPATRSKMMRSPVIDNMVVYDRGSRFILPVGRRVQFVRYIEAKIH